MNVTACPGKLPNTKRTSPLFHVLAVWKRTSPWWTIHGRKIEQMTGYMPGYIGAWRSMYGDRSTHRVPSSQTRAKWTGQGIETGDGTCAMIDHRLLAHKKKRLIRHARVLRQCVWLRSHRRHLSPAHVPSTRCNSLLVQARAQPWRGTIS